MQHNNLHVARIGIAVGGIFDIGHQYIVHRAACRDRRGSGNKCKSREGTRLFLFLICPVPSVVPSSSTVVTPRPAVRCNVASLPTVEAGPCLLSLGLVLVGCGCKCNCQFRHCILHTRLTEACLEWIRKGYKRITHDYNICVRGVIFGFGRIAQGLATV